MKLIIPATRLSNVTFHPVINMILENNIYFLSQEGVWTNIRCNVLHRKIRIEIKVPYVYVYKEFSFFERIVNLFTKGTIRDEMFYPTMDEKEALNKLSILLIEERNGLAKRLQQKAREDF